jgi:hypothetical protein
VRETTESGAIFDETGQYRYALWRVWDPERPRLCFVLLNPSTADAEHSDPTIRRCLGFARAWEFGSLEVVNLFAYRATHPADLFRAVDPVGPENDSYIREAVARAARVVVGWGCHGAKHPHSAAVLALMPASYCYCLGVTKSKQPRHPLYLPANISLQTWQMP